jgi:hypothetical protein
VEGTVNMNRKNDPYRDKKIVHKADKINERGQASALCFDPPRAINLKIAKYVFAPENDPEVTCKKCLKLMEQAIKPEQTTQTAEAL